MPKRRRARKTLLKIRATPLVAMPKSRFFLLIRQACETGIVPADIRISSLNWDHSTGRRYSEGQRLSASDTAELRECAAFLFGAVGKSDVRVERPDY